MKKSLLTLACCYALTGCVSTPTPEYRPPYIPPVKTQEQIDRDNGVIVQAVPDRPVVPAEPTPEVAPDFFASEVSWSRYDGENTLMGSVEYFPTLTGEAASCAGTTVVAVPKSRYATHRMYQVYENAEGGESINIPTTADSEYVKYVKFAECDVNNEFTFEKLATGTWYIITGVTWTDRGQEFKTGFMKRAFVSNNGYNFVVLHP
jgi:hypothetical protein